MAQEPPSSARALQSLKGADRRVLARHQRLIFEALERAHDAPVPKRPPKPPRPSAAETARVERLKAWRKRVCEGRGVESDVVMPNRVLTAIATAAPPDLDGLAELSALDDWQLDHYGPQILAALRGKA